jgi:hypothetical protein
MDRCIDQSNIKERNHQVRLMKSIYSESMKTFVYLGEPRETGNLAVELGNKIVAMTKKFEPGVQIVVSKLELPPIEAHTGVLFMISSVSRGFDGCGSCKSIF